MVKVLILTLDRRWNSFLLLKRSDKKCTHSETVCSELTDCLVLFKSNLPETWNTFLPCIFKYNTTRVFSQVALGSGNFWVPFKWQIDLIFYSKHELFIFLLGLPWFYSRFDSSVGLRMNSETTVTTFRSDSPSSVTKFGEKKHITHHLALVWLFYWTLTFFTNKWLTWFSSLFTINICIKCRNCSKSQTLFKVTILQDTKHVERIFKVWFTTMILLLETE